ncbi:MAG: hypothetical protein HY700_12160 [Gemmatimonadetes bacterium]|nr:hypothetical protein [Gemmatimonadota bacterium]
MTSARLPLVLILLVSACSPGKPVTEPAPAPLPLPPTPVAGPAVVETVTVRDPDVDRRIGRLELRLLERDAQLEDLQLRLADARQEVVRAMAKLQTLATRAEAASGMAEAEVALQTLKSGAGQQSTPEAEQAGGLLEQSSAEFNKQNYGGALYLANQAKTLATAGRGRLSPDERGASRPGETAFAVPVKLKSIGRGNVREGPGTTFKVAFAAEPGLLLTGYSYVDEWIRVTDDSGRDGWIFRNLVSKR